MLLFVKLPVSLDANLIKKLWIIKHVTKNISAIS